jgi:hypothetical protein
MYQPIGFIPSDSGKGMYSLCRKKIMSTDTTEVVPVFTIGACSYGATLVEDVLVRKLINII